MMYRRLVSSTVVLSLLGLAAPAWADEDSPFEFEGLVQLAPGANIADFHTRYGTSTIESYVAQNIYRVALPPTIPADTFEALVATDAEVLHADRVFPVLDTNPVGSSQSFFFFDVGQRFGDQPAWGQIDLPDVAPHASATGAGVTVAVVDTGVAAHPFLAGSAAPGGYNFVERNANTNDFADTLDNNQNGVADEYAGHGTMVAGLVRRVAPQSSILAIRVMDDEGRCDTFKLVAGIHHAIDNGADVINLSLGTIDPSDVLLAAVNRALAAEIVIAAAAGNDDRPDPRRYPAGFNLPGVLAIAACDEFDVRAPFSNYGAHIDLIAPGVEITSTLYNLGFGRGSGTSLGAPLVAGTLARMRGARPGASGADLRDLLLDSTDGIAAQNPSYLGQLGAGRLNVARAVDAALGRGDMDCDGFVSVADIGAFVLALTDPAQYPVAFPQCRIEHADTNGDGVVTVGDVGTFVGLLIGG
ncbi:MAG: S8 family serine peptidase [Phycisphaerae bacterium]|nr:S8 family serine peptidase [Phycisphaerae bacterium]